MVPAHLSAHYSRSRGQAPKPVRWTMCFLLMTSILVRIHAWTTQFYIICTYMSKWWGMLFVYICLTHGGRNGLRWSALSGHWLSCTECWLYLLSMEWLMCGTHAVSTHIILTRTFLSTHHLYEKNGLNKLSQTSSIWDLHTILSKISRGVPGLATHSPCGVWGMVHF